MHRYLWIVGIYALFACLEYLRAHDKNGERPTPGDVKLELMSISIIGAVTAPAVLWLSALLTERLSPGSAEAWATWPLWAKVLLLIVGDDLTQYAWHRTSHSVPFLYTLHRAHHSPRYMGVRIMYRNNIFYYAMMPGIWVSGALIHLGFGSVYAVYLVTKLTIIMGAHSTWHWDEVLYRNPRLHWLAWIVERTLSTPATHSAHHGRHADDGVTHYAGNYGNLLFLWDVLFRTAHITRRYPKAFGIEGLAPQPWYVELAWPLFPRR